MSAVEVKEVVMDAPQEGRTSRRKRSGGKRAGRKSRVASGEDDATIVTKDEHVSKASASSSASASVHKPIVGPKVVIAPPKKKPIKVMLVPKGKVLAPRSIIHKTFKAKSVKVTIDNTAKTRKSRAESLAKVDAMTDDQIRAAAVQARLSRRETVGKAPIGLLRQMVKDYQIMKGRLQ